MAEPKHPTCLDVSTFVRPDIYVCGPECPTPEQEALDRARDARRRVYAEDRRRAAARALDRYIEVTLSRETTPSLWLDAGEEFIGRVGDYVEARLQHSGNYGVPRCPVNGGWCNTCRIGGGNGTGGQCAREQNPDSGVPPETIAEAMTQLDRTARRRPDSLGQNEHRGGDFACPGRAAAGPNSRPVCGMPDWNHDAHMYGSAAGACQTVYVYVLGSWDWLSMGTAEREGLRGRACMHRAGHVGPHQPDEPWPVNQRWCSCITGNTATDMHPYGVDGCRYGPSEGASEMPRVEGPS